MMSNFLPTNKFIILLIISFISMSFNVNAQQVQSKKTAADKSKIEIIEVTAQKRTQSINEIPMAITAFNADQLSEMGIEDTADLAAIVPGFNYSNTAFGPPVYTLRGVGFNESSAQATATVGVYIDEISIPFPIMTKGIIIDIERVEILKGPQGTLYGSNATAGAINYIAAKPSDDFDAGIKATLASFQTYSGEGFLNGSLTEDLNARFALKIIHSGEGWQQSVSRDDTLGKQDKIAARLSFDINIGAVTKALIRFGYSKDRSDSLAPQAIEYLPAKAGGPVNASYPIFEPILDVNANPHLFPGNGDDISAADWTADRNPALAHQTTSISLSLTHELSSNMTLTALTGYTKFKDNGSEYERGGTAGVTAGFIRKLTGGPLDTLLGGSLANFYEGHLHGDYFTIPDSEYVPSDYVFQHGKIDSFSQELRITQALNDIVWIAGLYYSKSNVDYKTTQDWGLATNVNILPMSGFGFNKLRNVIVQATTTYGIFANADWNINDELTITTGLRYTEDTADYTGCTEDIGGPGVALFNQFFFAGEDSGTPINGCVTVIDFGMDSQRTGQIIDTLAENSLSWRLAANYKLTQDSSVYASYSRGFKAGSYPSLAAIVSSQLDPVVQEQLDAYEIGMKSLLAEGTAQLNMSIFYYDYQDKQLLTKKTIPVFRTAFTLGNMDDSFVQGIELDLKWLPLAGLTVMAAIGVLDTEITKGDGFNQLGQSVVFAGSPLPFTSKFQANILTKYEWNISDSLFAFVAIDGAYTSAYNTDFKAEVTMTTQVSDFTGSPVEVNIPPQSYAYDNRFTQDDYIIVNVRIGIGNINQQWKAFLWARNLTDEYFVSSVVKNNEMIAAYSGMTRTFGLTFEYNAF
ncbi:TonB-dependent receptor [Colwellia marinimaniae]|uniref:TonB-dependent receptor n=2 Tax=Colwelliaceae TaxID=267889 RepID=A0ABQ0MWI1_9GAMM|nr:TonB-dependent receptor [Colwellia marinimaniae]